MNPRFFFVERSQHVYLTFIAEAHEGLCTVSTVDNARGIVKIIAPEGREHELESFIKGIKEEISMEELSDYSTTG